jgi:hypothetical protein
VVVETLKSRREMAVQLNSAFGLVAMNSDTLKLASRTEDVLFS